MQAPPLPPKKANNNVLWIVLGVIGVCGCGGVVVLAAILFPVFNQAKLAAQRTSQKTASMSNLKQTAIGVLIYTTDFDDKMPPAAKWMDLTEPLVSNPAVFKSIVATPDDPSDYGFAFRKELGGKATTAYADPERWAMVFDSDILTRNANSGLETLPTPGRYGTGSSHSNLIGFMDGHVKSVKDEDRNAVGADGKPQIK